MPSSHTPRQFLSNGEGNTWKIACSVSLLCHHLHLLRYPDRLNGKDGVLYYTDSWEHHVPLPRLGIHPCDWNCTGPWEHVCCMSCLQHVRRDWSTFFDGGTRLIGRNGAESMECWSSVGKNFVLFECEESPLGVEGSHDGTLDNNNKTFQTLSKLLKVQIIY